MVSNSSLGLYIHWPFCKKKCPYCDFNSHVRDEIDQKRWLKALQTELRSYADKTNEHIIDSVYFGGGTPSLMAPFVVEGLIDIIHDIWSVDESCEITLEANPTSSEGNKFKAFKAAGVNRLSVGVQAFNDEDLQFLGREHSVLEAQKVIELARETFSKYSFDLIYARPEQSLKSWEEELLRALEFSVGHISLYQLTIEQGTQFFHQYNRGDFKIPGEDLSTDLYELTDDILKEYGFDHYEISNFAKQGHQSRHNLRYWRYEDYLGIGPGAHGRFKDLSGVKYASRTHNAPEIYLDLVSAQNTGIKHIEEVSKKDQFMEMVMMGLRLSQGIAFENIQKQTGKSLQEWIPNEVFNVLYKEGDLEKSEDFLCLTKQGRRRLNMVLSYLFDKIKS